MTAPLRSAPFRWWGAKVRMAPWIIDRLPPHDHYIEACAGSAAILALKPPAAAETINDLDGAVVNFFRVLRDPQACAELIDLVAFTPYSREEFRDALRYIGDAGELVDPTPSVPHAWAFFVTMQMAVVPGRTGWSYGKGGAATKKANKAGRWSTMPDHLAACAARFARVQVERLDVLEILDRYDAPGTLILIDPPYTEASRPTSTGASSGYAVDMFDHAAFLDAVTGLKHATAAITHYPDPIYDGAGLTPAGDYSSHRNIPNGAGRDKQIERLYLFDPVGSATAGEGLFA